MGGGGVSWVVVFCGWWWCFVGGVLWVVVFRGWWWCFVGGGGGFSWVMVFRGWWFFVGGWCCMGAGAVVNG